MGYHGILLSNISVLRKQTNNSTNRKFLMFSLIARKFLELFQHFCGTDPWRFFAEKVVLLQAQGLPAIFRENCEKNMSKVKPLDTGVFFGRMSLNMFFFFFFLDTLGYVEKRVIFSSSEIGGSIFGIWGGLQEQSLSVFVSKAMGNCPARPSSLMARLQLILRDCSYEDATAKTKGRSETCGTLRSYWDIRMSPFSLNRIAISVDNKIW